MFLDQGRSGYKFGKVILFSVSGLFILGGVLFFTAEHFVEPQVDRAPANVPTAYESLKACEKQDILWKEIKSSAYQELPQLQKLGIPQLVVMGRQRIDLKGNYQSDFAPPKWIKYLHRHGTIAKVKIVPVAGSEYTGAFQGVDCGLLRLSLTYKVEGDRAVAPGLALKALRDGVPSGNISALVSLDGQNKEYNFFKYAMSNIVPVGDDLGQKWVHSIFSKVSGFPEELRADELSSVESSGRIVSQPHSPRQIFFQPGPGLATPSSQHDVRASIEKIPAGTVIYKILAVPDSEKSFDYVNQYTDESVNAFQAKAIHIADIVTTSEFVASGFGDDGIFFRHQLKY